MRAALAHRLGSDDINGRRVAVAGVGHVGRGVAERLHAAGARLLLADVRADAAKALADCLGAELADPATIHEAEADVYAPCALGGVLSAETIPALGAPIVAGAANNQLATPADGARLLARGILYAPDYVINAGGVISIAVGDEEGEAAALARIDAIGATLREIFARADAQGAGTERVAARMAEERLAAARPRARAPA